MIEEQRMVNFLGLKDWLLGDRLVVGDNMDNAECIFSVVDTGESFDASGRYSEAYLTDFVAFSGVEDANSVNSWFVWAVDGG